MNPTKIALQEFLCEELQAAIDAASNHSNAKVEPYEIEAPANAEVETIPIETSMKRELTEAEKEGLAILESRGQFYTRMSI